MYNFNHVSLPQNKKLSTISNSVFIICAGELKAAFEKHFVTYGGLDICINSAGIGDIIPFRNDRTDGSKSWRHTVNVNLIAVIDSTRLAVNSNSLFYGCSS